MSQAEKMPLIAIRMFSPTFLSPIPPQQRRSYTCSWPLYSMQTFRYGLLDVLNYVMNFYTSNGACLHSILADYHLFV